ncbi:MAG: MmcQ/YjbR family DNA-binding protein [Mycobacteriales bacterium]
MIPSSGAARALVLERCEALPAAELCYPFGEDTAVFKVRGKMFALVDLADEHGRVTVKADPGDAAALAVRHRQITPGYYMDKRHWITVELADAAGAPLPTGQVDELLEDSYRLVVAGLPARRRPVPPAPVSQTAPRAEP